MGPETLVDRAKQCCQASGVMSQKLLYDVGHSLPRGLFPSRANKNNVIARRAPVLSLSKDREP